MRKLPLFYQISFYSRADKRTTDGRPYNNVSSNSPRNSNLKDWQRFRISRLKFFSVLSLEGKNQRNFEKACDSKKAKVPKSKKHRNELAHFCGFGFRDKAPLVPQWDLIKSHCIFCLANSGCTHYPKVFGVQWFLWLRLWRSGCEIDSLYFIACFVSH